MQFKETTLIALVITACATVLAAMRIIDGVAWAVAVGATGLGKGIQGAADRFKPNSNPTTNPG